MNNIKKAFENKALICFLMAGDPDLNTTKEVIISMEKAGCDMVELGVPFSDPIAEKEVRNTTQISIILHTYINPVFNYRYEEFFMKCSEVNVCGIVVPDLPYEEKSEIKEYADKYGVDIISFVVPENIDRVKMIAKEATGFIYFVPSIGSTSSMEGHFKEITSIIDILKENTNIPIALGFGINTTQQAEFFSEIADGIIVGNAIVKIVEKYGKDSPSQVFDYVKAMKSAIKIK